MSRSGGGAPEQRFIRCCAIRQSARHVEWDVHFSGDVSPRAGIEARSGMDLSIPWMMKIPRTTGTMYIIKPILREFESRMRHVQHGCLLAGKVL